MIPEQFVFVGVFLNLIGQLLYVKSILYGNTKPNLVSWFFWMIAPWIGFFLEIKAGATYSALPIFMAGFGPFLVILASICKKSARWKIGTFDICCAIFAATALVFYILTHNLSISILFAILSDLTAAIPTVIKSWKFPETESINGYAWYVLNNIIGLMVIKSWSFSTYSFGLYLIIFDTIIVVILLRKKLFKTRN